MGGEITIMNKQKARHSFAMLKIRENQSILDFKKSFRAAVDLMIQIEAGEPDKATQAVEFLAKCDEKRYGVMLDTMRNNVDMGIQLYPDTVEAAALLLDKFRIPNQTTRGEDGSARLVGKPTAFSVTGTRSENV